MAFDGDADRIYFIDEKARFVSGTIITAVIAEALLKKHPGQTILYNAIVGRIVPEIIKKFGGKGIRVKVGHTLIKEAMRKKDALFAGEHSGHYYFRNNYYADSAFIAMLVCLELFSERNKPLSQIISEFDKYPIIPETNFEIKDKESLMRKIEKIYQDKAEKIDWLDGATLWFNDSFVNIRASNTQPLLRLNIEADNQKALLLRKKEFTKIIVDLGAKPSQE